MPLPDPDSPVGPGKKGIGDAHHRHTYKTMSLFTSAKIQFVLGISKCF